MVINRQYSKISRNDVVIKFTSTLYADCLLYTSSKQLVEGENYRQLQPIYQIIFVNACPQNEKRLINRYIMRDPYGEAESKEPLLRRIYIQLPMIDEIAKEKGMEAMNDFEQVCYFCLLYTSRCV